MQKWIDDYDILTYSIHNEGILIVPEKLYKR